MVSRCLPAVKLSDNVIAILTRSGERPDAVRQILTRIAGLQPPERETAFKQLLFLSGLRRLEEFVTEEARKMPILNDIMEHRVIGPAIRQGLDQGRQEGRQEGKHEEAVAMLRRLIVKRFGAIPDWAAEQLGTKSTPELEDLSVRIFDARDVEDLIQ